jgi:hypothetical protein
VLTLIFGITCQSPYGSANLRWPLIPVIHSMWRLKGLPRSRILRNYDDVPSNSPEYDRRYRSLRKESIKSLTATVLYMKADMENLRKEVENLRKEIGSNGFSPPNLPFSLTPPTPLVSLSERHSPQGVIRSLDSEFDEVWSLFPRKIDKGHARLAYRSARKKAAFDQILDGIRRLALKHQTTEPKFIPYPATWLNGEGWLDEDKPNGHDSGSAIPERSKPTGPPPPLVQRVE